jgi:dTDP-glucose 4,6-dehydratase
LNALEDKPLPVYGDGLQVRDWLYVRDHCRAIWLILQKGKAGETYNVGGHQEKTNLSVVEMICDYLDDMKPRAKPRRDLIRFIKDRPGHDRRYAIDFTKIRSELGFKPEESFETGLKKTIHWYLENPLWVKSARNEHFQKWYEEHYQL